MFGDPLPQMSGDRLFVTDGGMETTLIFDRGLDLPCFASFDLLRTEAGRDEIRAYFDPYLAVAREHQVGLILESPTWRASPDWGARLGYSEAELAAANRDGVALVEEIRNSVLDDATPIVINAAVGPRGDGYQAGETMSPAAAEHYHAIQIDTLAQTRAEMLTAWTMTNADEAIGIVRASCSTEMPVVISFTVETDGRLPSGQSLADAIERVDAETDAAAQYFMINCAHPTHFADAFDVPGPWRERVLGLRANASAKSHAELDESEQLDSGDPADLAARYLELRERLPQLVVFGGCCGSDHHHTAAICRALAD